MKNCDLGVDALVSLVLVSYPNTLPRARTLTHSYLTTPPPFPILIPPLRLALAPLLSLSLLHTYTSSLFLPQMFPSLLNLI